MNCAREGAASQMDARVVQSLRDIEDRFSFEEFVQRDSEASTFDVWTTDNETRDAIPREITAPFLTKRLRMKSNGASKQSSGLIGSWRHQNSTAHSADTIGCSYQTFAPIVTLVTAPERSSAQTRILQHFRPLHSLCNR